MSNRAQLAAPNDPAANAGRPVRNMPTRAFFTDNDTLQILFDLPAANRPSTEVIKPSHKNLTKPETARGKIPRYKWAVVHQNYLFEFLEYAILSVNRFSDSSTSRRLQKRSINSFEVRLFRVLFTLRGGLIRSILM
jgi:hypothetical protein